MSFRMNRIQTTACLVAIAILLLAGSCRQGASSKKKTASDPMDPESVMQIPAFREDSAYAYIVKQLEFGQRVPGTPEHKACAGWLEKKLTGFGADVIVQQAEVENWEGTRMPIHNIIARYQPEKANRLLLMAHWDTRAWADYDPDPEKRDLPIPGANDGASGVAVLLEIARQLQNHHTPLGIDIILFDAEDQGTPEHRDLDWTADSWCLGSQYWSRNPHQKDYYARYGILLDMVGAPQAIFTHEEVSVYYGQAVLDLVWKTARNLGYGAWFSYEKTPQIVDDHRYVNEILGIPSIVIIQYDHDTESNFGPYWHTHADDIDAIDPATLKAVGETLLHVIFNEK